MRKWIKKIIVGWLLIAGMVTGYAAEKDEVLRRVSQNGLNLRLLDEIWRGDKEVVLVAVRQNGLALEYPSPALKKDREVVLAAVRENGLALEFADSSLKRDRGIVLEAIRNNGFALLYADPGFKRDKDIVREAMRNNIDALVGADPGLLRDRSFARECVTYHIRALSYFSDALRQDRELALMALARDHYAVAYVSPQLWKNAEFVREAFQTNHFIVYNEFFPEEAIAFIDIKDLMKFYNQVSNLNLTGIEEYFSSHKGAFSVLVDHQTNEMNTKPLVLCIEAKYKQDEFYIKREDTIIELAERGYRVGYRQVSSDEEFIRVVKETGDKHPISLLLLHGHGRGEWVTFSKNGTEDEKSIHDTNRLDVQHDAGKLAVLRTSFAPGATMVLYACSTARGGKTATNVATMIARALPAVRVFAPLEDVSTYQLVFDERNGIEDVQYFKYDVGMQPRFLSNATLCIQPGELASPLEKQPKK